MEPNPLPGGAVNHVVRVGDTVRRMPGPRAGFVHRLLRFFEARNISGVPRYLGMDEQGREILTYFGGMVPLAPQEQADFRSSDRALTLAARYVRDFHDATAGTPLAGACEVVCHNDLAPKNTVCKADESGWYPYAFIDWDLAAPGERIHDIAHMCWQYLDLGPGVGDASEAGRRIGVICEAYGLNGRHRIVDVILRWQDRCCRGIEAGAERGEPALVRLRQQGVVAGVREASVWVADHRRELEAAVR